MGRVGVLWLKLTSLSLYVLHYKFFLRYTYIRNCVIYLQSRISFFYYCFLLVTENKIGKHRQKSRDVLLEFVCIGDICILINTSEMISALQLICKWVLNLDMNIVVRCCSCNLTNYRGCFLCVLSWRVHKYTQRFFTLVLWFKTNLLKSILRCETQKVSFCTL